MNTQINRNVLPEGSDGTINITRNKAEAKPLLQLTCPDTCSSKFDQSVTARVGSGSPINTVRQAEGRFHIKEGHAVIHKDKHGESNGVADSDAMMSSNRIKIRFTSGPRMGECRWVPLNEVLAICPLPEKDEPWPDSRITTEGEIL